MPSGLIAALAAPIREVAAQVGPGWSDEGDPTTSLAQVRDRLADISAAARNGWSRTAEGWSGAGADGAATFMSGVAESADRLALRIDELRVSTAGAADAVAWARSRLRDILSRFEERAAAIEARLDEPGAAEELREEARRALNEAVAVVDELRTELDGHAASASPHRRHRPRPRDAKWRADSAGRVRRAVGLEAACRAVCSAALRPPAQNWHRFRCPIRISSETESPSHFRTAAR